MNLRRLKNSSHYLFFAITAVALVSNIFFDYFAYTENDISDRLGYSVRDAVLAEKSLDSFGRSLSRDYPQDKQMQYKKELEKYSSDFPELIPILRTFNPGEPSSKKLNQAIQEAQTSLDEKIDLRGSEDRNQNDNVKDTLTAVLNFDLFLIFLMLTLFIINLRSKKKLETSLRKSQKSLMETLLALEEQTIKRKIATKSVVHDLRSPIGTIIGFAELIKEEPTSRSSVIETSERIQKISHRSLQLVESLLAESDTPLMFAPLDLYNLTQDVCDRMSILAEEKDQHLVFDSRAKSTIISGNELKLDEAITNLISNAIKYSPKQTSIQVSLSETESAIQLTVKDQGPGFSAQDKLKAFQFATRLSAKPTNGETSSGIGLYIVKGIIEAHHSKISIEDNPDGIGCSMVLSFPKLSPPRPEAYSSPLTSVS